VATGSIRTIKAGSGEILSVTFSTDGSRVLSGYSDSTMRLWDAATGTLVRTIKGHSNGVLSVAFSPDGTRTCRRAVTTAR
jgi:WD40 repeat protein